MKYPAAHGWHATLASTNSSPDAHAVQLPYAVAVLLGCVLFPVQGAHETFALAAICPAPQASQVPYAVAGDAAWTLPVSQSTHGLVALRAICPALHVVHKVAPLPVVY